MTQQDIKEKLARLEAQLDYFGELGEEDIEWLINTVIDQLNLLERSYGL